MTVQKTVGVRIGDPAKHQSGGNDQLNPSGPANQQSNTTTLQQIPNQSLLVSGSQLPQRPAFDAVSTGSFASDQRATLVGTARSKTVPTTASSMTGWLPQTSEVATGVSVLVGVMLLALLGRYLFRTLRHDLGPLPH